jgi:GNAT superfamily N-acetyltransferase
VLANPERALGYTLAAPDWAAFDRRLQAEWWPYVRKQLAGFEPRTFDDARLMDRIGVARGEPEWLLADYPAHMHINILPEAQGLGWGRRMIDVQLAALKAHGVSGVHLGVLPANKPAMTFYRHLGFDDISRDGRVIFAKRLVT